MIILKYIPIMINSNVRAKKSGPLIGAIVECLIPAGSKIVTGIDKGLIVSDQIIITDVIARI